MDQVHSRLQGIWNAGFDEVLFSGGEPTIHPQFLEISGLCADAGRRFGLITNARMFSHEPFFKSVMAHGLDYVYLSLHGRLEAHEAVTQVVGSYGQTLRAIQRLSQVDGVSTTVNMVMTTRNLSEAPMLARSFAPLSQRLRLKFSLVEPRGAAQEDASLHPHPVEAARVLQAAWTQWSALGGKPSSFGFDGIPHCLVPQLRGKQDDMYTHGIVALQELADETIFAVDYNNMHKPAICRGCLIGDECRCTWAGTLTQQGEEWLRPVQGFVPNSYNYLPVPPGAHKTQAGAPVKGRKPMADPRRLSVDLGKGPVEYHTDTGDFSDAQLRRIVDDLGQVYVQQDSALFLDDFAGQLRKLVCTPGPVSAPGSLADTQTVWCPADEDLFLKADLPVRKLLDQVRGNVADVGCGPAYYFERLLPGIHSGAVLYQGIDPRPGPEIERVALDGRIQLQRCGIEEAVLPRGSLDWALVLRSHNHLGDLWTAYRRIVGALKWGGKLLVVDNVAFGLVRPGLAKEVLDAVPAGEGQEHLRDHDGKQALAFLDRFPLRLVQQWHLGPSTANQWVLLFEKAWPAGAFGEEGFC